MSIEVKIADRAELKEWNDIVKNSPHGTLFHTLDWLKIVEKHTHSKLYPLIGLKGSTAVGVFPIFYKKNSFIKSVFSPPPQVAIPYLGPVLVDYEKLKQTKKESVLLDFQKSVDEFMFSEIKPDYISISLTPGLLDSRPFKWANYHVVPSYDYLITLENGIDQVWEQFNKGLRNDITRAKKRGVSVEEGSIDELCFIYDSIVKRYENQDRSVNISKEYLLDLYASFHPKNLNIFVSKYKDEIISGLVLLCYGDSVSAWSGTSKSYMPGISPNDLLQWEVMKWAFENGFKRYREVGANTQRLCHFKSKYNPQLSIYFSARKYPSFMSKFAERSYVQVLKPLRNKLGYGLKGLQFSRRGVP